jgi:hypothetical protein
LGKLFTAILNARLNDYTEEFMILKENQSGFRQSLMYSFIISSSPQALLFFEFFIHLKISF